MSKRIEPGTTHMMMGNIAHLLYQWQEPDKSVEDLVQTAQELHAALNRFVAGDSRHLYESIVAENMAVPLDVAVLVLASVLRIDQTSELMTDLEKVRNSTAWLASQLPAAEATSSNGQDSERNELIDQLIEDAADLQRRTGRVHASSDVDGFLHWLGERIAFYRSGRQHTDAPSSSLCGDHLMTFTGVFVLWHQFLKKTHPDQAGQHAGLVDEGAIVDLLRFVQEILTGDLADEIPPE